jgi:diketogulonate reductase-like aldo/keto reductase
MVECYSPLTKAKKLEDPRLVEIAQKYHMSAAQVLIRWCLQKGYIVIPKSVHEERIRENAQVFDKNISPEDMKKLDGFDEYLVTGWDPTVDP